MSVAVNKWKYRLQYLNYIGGVTTLSRKLYQVTKGGRLCPPNSTGTPGFSDLPTALNM